MHQRTLAGPIEFSGIGLHTGEQASLRVLPAPAGKGIVFRRVDLDNFELRADVASVARVAYATTLMSRGVWISTVEHLLSALYGTGIDNAYIELDNFEVPILDGSAFPYTEAITHAGIVRQRTLRQYIRITKPFVLKEGDKTLGIYPSDTFTIKYDIDFPHPLIGKQSLEVQLRGANYAQHIAPARTFAFRQEVEALLAAGLAQGGSLENALIITPPDGFSTPLRLPSEWCAHKLLDLIGDLALLDARLALKLTALRPGHRINARFAQTLLQSGQTQKE